MRARIGEGEGIAAALDTICGLGVEVQAGTVTPLPYPDMFKHLHGREGLERTDETLWVTEASDNIWNPQEERLSPPFQELVPARKGEASGGPPPPPSSPLSSQIPFSAFALPILLLNL